MYFTPVENRLFKAVVISFSRSPERTLPVPVANSESPQANGPPVSGSTKYLRIALPVTGTTATPEDVLVAVGVSLGAIVTVLLGSGVALGTLVGVRLVVGVRLGSRVGVDVGGKGV
jgi:hypothetical protein